MANGSVVTFQTDDLTENFHLIDDYRLHSGILGLETVMSIFLEEAFYRSLLAVYEGNDDIAVFRVVFRPSRFFLHHLLRNADGAFDHLRTDGRKQSLLARFLSFLFACEIAFQQIAA